MNPHQNPRSHRTSYLLRLLAATLITAAIAATAACSGDQPPPTHRPETSDRNLSKTIEAMASEIENLNTKVANPSHNASVVTLCDDILKHQFVFQRNASTVEALNAIISVIQNQRVDQCSVDVWNPTAADASQQLGCFTHETIGKQDVPSGLHRTPTDPRARLNSGRDRDNNIIVHWSGKPADETNCWLYVARLSTWSVE